MVTSTAARIRLIPWLLHAALALFLGCAAPALACQDVAQPADPLPPPPEAGPRADDGISPALRAALRAEYLTDDERIDLRVFHGLWTEDDLSTPRRRAMAALNGDLLDDPALSDPSVPIEWRAQALLNSGNLDGVVESLTSAPTPLSPRAVLVLARALEGLGRFGEAGLVMEPVVADLSAGRLTSAADLTDAAECLAMRAVIRGEPGRNFQAILAQLGRVHQEIDRLYWPAKLAEARLLADKDQAAEAAAALGEVLALNPRCSEAWQLHGQLAVAVFNFADALECVERLRAINPAGIRADLLSAEIDLSQNMPDEAQRTLDGLLARYPGCRDALALRAAVEAVRYDEDGALNRLDDLDRVSPGHPFGYYACGVYLSRNRQYELAARMLEEATRRQPNWAAPLVERGLMELQSGRDAQATEALRRAAHLDPYNRRTANSLRLIESLAACATIKSEHFIIRFDPAGADRALALEMLAPLEQIHSEVSRAFQYTPDRPTLIELLPNHERFAVRITGVPELHTIAACTGPVIAMEVPRAGPGHFGPYDWQRVIRHEYVHTITLGRTRNRIPHWFTEAAAVWQEISPRDYGRCQMLADAWRNDELFDLDEINWAFIRPRRPIDRALAYAQGHWMFEYLIERFGHSTMLALLDEFATGVREPAAMPTALGVSRAEFYDGFVRWAGAQVAAWGLDPHPTLGELTEDAAAGAALPGAGVDPGAADAALADLLNHYPTHPDVLWLAIDRDVQRDGPTEALVPLLERYQAARPVDPTPQRLLAQIFLASPQPERALPHLEELDRYELHSGTFAHELARRYRALGQLDLALARVERAVSIEPFNPTYRETAAAIAVEAHDYAAARRHLEALVLIEPDRPQHQHRLDALSRLESGR